MLAIFARAGRTSRRWLAMAYGYLFATTLAATQHDQVADFVIRKSRLQISKLAPANRSRKHTKTAVSSVGLVKYWRFRSRQDGTDSNDSEHGPGQYLGNGWIRGTGFIGFDERCGIQPNPQTIHKTWHSGQLRILIKPRFAA